MRPSPLNLILLATLLLPGSAHAQEPPPPAAPVDRALDDVPDATLRTLGKRLAGYLDARIEGGSVVKPRTVLLEEAAELADELGIGSLLERPDLIGRAWTLARPPVERRVKRGKTVEVEAKLASFGSDPLRFAVAIPRRYSPREREHPLVVVLAPAYVEREAAIAAARGLGARDIGAGSLAAGDDADGAATRDSAMFLCPVLPAELGAWTAVTQKGRPGGIRVALAAIDEAVARFAVDVERIHLVGFGLGAQLALCVADHAPQRFASVYCQVEELDTLDRAPRAANLRTVPVLFNTRSAITRPFLDDAVARGYDRITSRSTWLEGGPWDWFAAHRRAALPPVVTVRPGVSYPTRVHWLAVDSVARDSEATATIDRDRQRIVVEAKGCGSVRLLLNDELLDLRYPIDVVVNGRKSRLTATREWATAFDLIGDGTSDPGRVYVSEVRMKVPSD